MCKIGTIPYADLVPILHNLSGNCKLFVRKSVAGQTMGALQRSPGFSRGVPETRLQPESASPGSADGVLASAGERKPSKRSNRVPADQR